MCALGVALLSGVAGANGFIGPYAPENFILTNNPTSNGYAYWPDTQTLVLTGPNSGSGLSGTTDLYLTSMMGAVIRFDWAYSTVDDPEYDDAGYLLSSSYYQLANENEESGTVVLHVSSGDTFGFRVNSVDNLTEPGIITVTNFSAETEVPEPSSWGLMLAGLGALIGVRKGAWKRFAAWRSIGSVAAAIFFLAGPGLCQQYYYSGGTATGQLVLTRVVNLTEQAQSFRIMGAQNSLIKEKLPVVTPTRLRPPQSVGPMALTGASLSQPGLNVVQSSTWGFNGISHRDQKLAGGGNQFSVEPPSQSIAAGNGYVLEGVNNAVQVYNTAGTPILPIVVSTNQLFGVAPAINYATEFYGVYPTDMRVYYDDTIDRWFVLQRAQDNYSDGTPLNSSHLYLAVSKTGDPTGDYNIYVMETTNMGHAGCPCIADYPQIGSDQYAFHIAWNEFASYSVNFVDAAIMSISKSALASGADSPAAYRYYLPFTSGFEFAIQPATTPPGASNFLANGGLEYFVSSYARFGSGNQLALWAMYNTSSLATGTGAPVLIRTVLPTLPYSMPDAASQKPGALPYGSSLKPPGLLSYLDGGDMRVQSVSYASARLYITLPTAVSDANGSRVVGGAYIVISPKFRSGQLSGTVLNQSYLAVTGNHILRPAVAVNASGVGAVAVTLVGPTWYPSAAFIPIDTFSLPSTLEVVAQGALPEDGFTGYPDLGGVGLARWGDYNTAVYSNDGSIWMVIQWIGDYPRTEYANWNTFVVRK